MIYTRKKPARPKRKAVDVQITDGGYLQIKIDSGILDRLQALELSFMFKTFLKTGKLKRKFHKLHFFLYKLIGRPSLRELIIMSSQILPHGEAVVSQDVFERGVSVSLIGGEALSKGKQYVDYMKIELTRGCRYDGDYEMSQKSIESMSELLRIFGFTGKIISGV